VSCFFENLPDEDEYNMLIFKHENEKDSKIDNILFYSIPNQYNFDYKRCKYTFVQAILKMSYNNSYLEYKINLRDNKNNYYIVNNRLNSTFFGYFLKTELGVNYDMQDVSYTLTIIDQDVRQIILTEKNDIILLENDYTVIDTPDGEISSDEDN
jgi:hypothetical protein